MNEDTNLLIIKKIKVITLWSFPQHFLHLHFRANLLPSNDQFY
jgi:hypothetical protein